MKRLIILMILILIAAPGFPIRGETSTTTAGIFVDLDVFIEQFDSEGKVTYSFWGDQGFGFLWGQGIQMKDGKFEGNVFSGSWDFADPSNHHTGKITIVLDDVI